MTAPDELLRFEKRLVEEIHIVENAGRCLVCSRHDTPAVKGHVVPRSRLALIAERCGSTEKAVRTFTMGLNKLQARAAHRLPEVEDEPDVECVSIGSDRLTHRLACATHDGELFAPVDGPGLDASDAAHSALIALRTVIFHRRAAMAYADPLRPLLRTAEFRALAPWYRDYLLSRARSASVAARWARRAQRALWRDVQPASGRSTRSAYVHRAMVVAGRPRVAFAGVLLRGGVAGWTPRERAADPALTAAARSPVHFVLTCYPDPRGHIVVASCPGEVASLLPVVFPAFDEGRSDREAVLSASALDVAEHIMIAPSAWDTLGPDRQMRMWRRCTAQPGSLPDALSDHPAGSTNLFV